MSAAAAIQPSDQSSPEAFASHFRSLLDRQQVDLAAEMLAPLVSGEVSGSAKTLTRVAVPLPLSDTLLRTGELTVLSFSCLSYAAKQGGCGAEDARTICCLARISQCTTVKQARKIWKALTMDPVSANNMLCMFYTALVIFWVEVEVEVDMTIINDLAISAIGALFMEWSVAGETLLVAAMECLSIRNNDDCDDRDKWLKLLAWSNMKDAMSSAISGPPPQKGGQEVPCVRGSQPSQAQKGVKIRTNVQKLFREPPYRYHFFIKGYAVRTRKR